MTCLVVGAFCVRPWGADDRARLGHGQQEPCKYRLPPLEPSTLRGYFHRDWPSIDQSPHFMHATTQGSSDPFPRFEVLSTTRGYFLIPAASRA